MIDPDDAVPISALQHFVYCQRQCALIHVEQVWSENVFTLRGRRAHERVDTPGHRTRSDERFVRALDIWNYKLGIVGRADVVIFRRNEPPYPIEHKVGAKKKFRANEIQLCAQVLCLEEMFQCSIKEGALFYGKSRRRRAVEMSDDLRSETLETIKQTRELISQRLLPEPVADSRCRHCSLVEACMPYASRRLSRLDAT